MTQRRTAEEKQYYLTAPWVFKLKVEELNNVEEKVTWLLARKEHLRNCDKCLIMYYWKIVDGLKKINKQAVHALTSSETIRRVRQHIQNDLALYLPTDEDTRHARKITEEAYIFWVQKNKMGG
jgi:hypothetical protein